MAGAGRAWARGRALQAVGRAGVRRSGCTELAGARQAERAVGWASGSRRGGRAGARGRHRQGRAGRPGRAAGPGWVFGAPDSVFGLV